MLTKRKIREKVLNPSQDNFIKVKYSFLQVDKKFQYLDGSKEVIAGSNTGNFFIRQLSENKLGITAGKLVRVINGATVHPDIRFAGHANVVDLEKCPNGYRIGPRDSVVLYSNEWFHMDSRTAGIIVSRVSNYMKGLVISSSYIDSTWQGLLELVITNISNEPKVISLGDEIGRIFFFELHGEKSSLVESEIASNSLHYGKSWEAIIRDLNDPFQKNSTAAVNPRKNWINVKNFLYEHYKTAGGILSLIGLLTLFFNAYSKINEATSLKEIVVKDKLQIEELSKNSFESGSSQIFMKGGQDYASDKIELKKHFTEGKIIFTNQEMTRDPNIQIVGSINNSGDKSSVEITILRKNDLKAKAYQFSFVVFP